MELYRQRWHIELDMRSLKQTLRLHSLRSRTPAMAEKELLLAIADYNLVRSVQMAAAQPPNLEPRRLRFSRVQAVVMTASPPVPMRPSGRPHTSKCYVGRPRQTAEQEPPPVLPQSSLGKRRRLSQTPASGGGARRKRNSSGAARQICSQRAGD